MWIFLAYRLTTYFSMMNTVRMLMIAMNVLLINISQADIYVIAHRDSAIETLDKHQVRDLYLSRSQNIAGISDITLFDRADADLRERFVQSIVGMSVRQFDAYWARLVFAGRVLPLSEAAENEELLRELKSNSNALGYMDNKPTSPRVKILLVVSE